MQILKTYMGVTTGSFAGRDDGYPELKTQNFDLLTPDGRDRFAASFNQEQEEKYYFLQPLTQSELVSKVNEILAIQRLEAELEEEENKRAEKEDLLARLKELEEEGY